MSGDYISLQLMVIKSDYLKCVHVPHSLFNDITVSEKATCKNNIRKAPVIPNELIITEYQMLANP